MSAKVEDIGTAVLAATISALVGGLMLMLALEVIHESVATAVIPASYWTSVWLAFLVRGALSLTDAKK